MDSYAAALAYLNRRVDYEKVRPVKFDPRNLNLARIEDLLARLGNPHTQYPVIHVAGTNGKGSVCALLDSMARAAGVRTGLYTSPHFHTLRERIRINGAMITRHDFVTRLNMLIPHIEKDSELTWFEIVTALGLLHFALERLTRRSKSARADVDATNVVTPRVSVITTLSMDHMAGLETRSSQIAAEAGIIKPNAPWRAPQKPAH
jgi:dihydrofolate synthase/folylpolyglutamate synthase